MDRAKLLEAHAELTAAIRAAETWEKSYTDSPDTFRRLLRQEGRLQAHANAYLLELRDRLPGIVNWPDAGLQPVLGAALPPDSDDVWKIELAALSAALGEDFTLLMTIGANAGEHLYSRPVGFTTLHEAVIKAARELTADKVSKITQGTKNLIQEAIKRSIAAGDDLATATQRVQQIVANPVRAEMIAQTESVNAYQAGLDLFGDETGVKSWTWDALSGACKLCAPLDGVTKKVGEFFVLGNGQEVLRPAAHTRCRCGRIANYDK